MTKKEAGTEVTGEVMCVGKTRGRKAGGKRKAATQRGVGCKRRRRSHRARVDTSADFVLYPLLMRACNCVSLSGIFAVCGEKSEVIEYLQKNADGRFISESRSGLCGNMSDL